ncbi:MAG: DUF86 domain-containing protein, partial [Patescibacteria group bacterium]|nr:DUF86 domain-containing protein [Patescibacteria group bacterium]
MVKTDKVYLEDILDAIDKITSFVQGTDFTQFEKDVMKQDAVIRRFEIIGEASGRLTKNFQNKYPKFPFRESKNMRNILIHDYSEVDLRDVWETIEKD